MNSFTSTSKLFLILPLLSTLLVAGCSDSGSPQSSAETGMTDLNIMSDDSSDMSADSPAVNVTVDTVETDSTMGVQVSPGAAAAPLVTNPVVTDPLNQNTTRVSFNITVPIYFSDDLQVKLVWGETMLIGQWVEGQFWTAAGDFPTNTEKLLIATFYDGNGETVLASYEAQFETGTKTTEIFKIAADQFDSSRWDTDEDGESNLNELIAGTDPAVDESAVLEVRTYTAFDGVRTLSGLDAIERVSNFYESSISGPLPYSLHVEESEPDIPDDLYRTTDITINIDVDGNGSVFDEHEYLLAHYYRETKAATRTNTDGVVTWKGTYYRFSSDAYNGQDITFSTESAIVDAQTRRLSGVIDSDPQGYGKRLSGPVHIEYDVTGRINTSYDRSRCTPIAGTIVYEHEHFNDRPHITGDTIYTDAITRITKQLDDEYWHVSSKDLEGQLIEEFLILSLGPVYFGPYCEANITSGASDYPAGSFTGSAYPGYTPGSLTDIVFQSAGQTALNTLRSAGRADLSLNDRSSNRTVFLPNRAAFAATGADFQSNAHFYSGALLSATDLTGLSGTIITMDNGVEHMIGGGGNEPLTINGVTMLEIDLRSDTGDGPIVHIIDGMLDPP